MDGLLEAGISHVSVYLLEIEKAPRLVSLKKEQPALFADDDEMADRWLEVDERLAAAGLPRYEISNWARPGFESRHNLKYWTLDAGARLRRRRALVRRQSPLLRIRDR